MKKLNVLLVCDRPRPGKNANTIVDHIDAIVEGSDHRVYLLSRLGNLPRCLDLGRFDVVVIHYSIYLLGENYLTQKAKAAIRDFPGLKVQFLQDEYRSVYAFQEMLKYLGTDVLFTCVPEEEWEKVYPEDRLPGLTKVQNLTGYVPPSLMGLDVPPIAERKVDVAYRGRKLPFWYGALALEKWQIVDRFMEAVREHQMPFKCDVSYREEDRIYGENWTQFISNARTTLGVESGASVFDFSGELEQQVDTYCFQNPDATFEEVRDKFFADREGKIRLNQISPRCFEAACLKTPMILFEGEYSGVLTPHEHYLPLKKDFSNIKEIFEIMKDDAALQAMADRTYQDVAMSGDWSYATFVKQFDGVVTREWNAKSLAATKSYSDESFRLACRKTFAEHAQQVRRVAGFRARRVLQGHRNRISKSWKAIPQERRNQLRPLLRPLRWLIGY